VTKASHALAPPPRVRQTIFVARPYRHVETNAVYHVNTRGNRGQPTFLKTGDRYDYYARLALVVKRCGWIVLADCQMTNHVHLLVQTPFANISEGMHFLNGTYAQSFNWHHGYRGHLWQDRFYSVVMEDNDQLKWAARYVVRNPVRAGIGDLPDEWKWSSCGVTAGRGPGRRHLRAEALLQYFSRDLERARNIYYEFVCDESLPERPEWALPARAPAGV
jgi:REP element-mobilizing transposase RayT